MDHPSSGGADNSFDSSLSALHSTSGDEYHMVHNDHDELTDVHTANSPASTPPPIVLNRKSSSPTGSNSSTELEDSPGSAVCTGKYFPRHVLYVAAKGLVLQCPHVCFVFWQMRNCIFII